MVLKHYTFKEFVKYNLFFIPYFLLHSQVEALLASEDYGKDLASVNNLLKKHQLLEADISAHEVLLFLLVLEDKS